MSRAGGFCPFIASEAGDPLHPLHIYPGVPGLSYDSPAAFRRGQGLGQSPNVFVFIKNSCLKNSHYLDCIVFSFVYGLISRCLSVVRNRRDTMSKHMTLSERKGIEILLKEGKSFKEIGRSLGKDCTTISKEIRYHFVERESGAWGQACNACTLRFGCKKSLLCSNQDCGRKKCNFCSICNNFCDSFIEEKCRKLDKPPYVCNGCDHLKKCTLRKKLYVAKDAQDEYEYVRSEARTGIAITEGELNHLDQLLTPLLKNGQSIHHICVNNTGSIMYSEKTLYHYIDSGLITARNIDLPRKVKYRPRKKAGLIHKVDRKCRIGRTYDDFHSYMEDNNHPLVVQMDSVIGRVGGKVLLTLHFVKSRVYACIFTGCKRFPVGN